MELERILVSESPALIRRLRPMAGSLDNAEDIAQETMARALTSAPRAVSEAQLRAWLHRVASNLAVDELRRGARRRLAPFDEAVVGAPAVERDDGGIASDEALERVGAADRLLLLLRFRNGLTHAEIAALLGISTPAARQRLSRARRAFVDAYRAIPRERAPRILVPMGEDEPEPYLRWLREAGADARRLPRGRFERDLSTADAVVIGGSRTDIDPAMYGEAPRAELLEPDLERDRHDVAVIRTALEHDIPVVGICRGHQLLNIAFGGTLHQDLLADRVATAHPDRHRI